jgi:hypothetical protein
MEETCEPSPKRQKTSLASVDPLLWNALCKPLDLAFHSESQSFKGLHDIVMSYAVSWFQGEFTMHKKICPYAELQ